MTVLLFDLLFYYRFHTGLVFVCWLARYFVHCFAHFFVSTHSCLRNVVSMFNVIEKELAWRKNQGLPEGFETLRECKPVVAVGAREPLGGQTMMADYFRGSDPFLCLGCSFVG